MTSTGVASTRPSTELGRAARGGAATFAGAAVSAGLGFLFSFLVARALGTSGAGVVLQTVAVFTMTMSVAKLGLDTAAVWLLPRLRGTEGAAVRPVVLALLVGALGGGLVGLALWQLVAHVLLTGGDREVVEALDVAFWMLPAATVMTVALAATRAFGGVVPFNLVGNIAVPALRPLGLGVAVALSGGAVAVAFAWSLAWLVGAGAALLVLVRQVARATRNETRWRPERAVVREVRGYALPRTLAAGLEQAMVWLDVVLVGILLGAAEAGVYGTAARFVSAGVIVATALRIVVAPRFSALLAQDRLDEVGELYSVTAQWILLFGAPVYVVLSVFAPTVLGWLGDGFDEGALSMAILCLGSVVVLAAGNVQALLLMSGRSGWGAVNKAVVVAVNVAGNLLLLPHFGIAGAAAMWAFCMVLDTALASYQVRRAVGLSAASPALLRVAVAVLVSTALPTLGSAWLLGQSLGGLVTAVVLSGVLLLAYARHDRVRLRLDQLIPSGR